MFPLVLIMFLLLLTIAVGLSYLLGFRLGGEQSGSELVRVRLEAARSEREIHDLTRQAFVAMAKHVERRKEQEPS